MPDNSLVGDMVLCTTSLCNNVSGDIAPVNITSSPPEVLNTSFADEEIGYRF